MTAVSKKLAAYYESFTERSPLAKAAARFLVVVGHSTRGFKSLPSPPFSKHTSYIHVPLLSSD